VKKKWHELVPGAVILEGGSAKEFKTGSWRNFRPVWVEKNCIQCMYCWLFCPDMAVTVEDGKMTGFDYDYCKGCGVCALECPGKKGNKAIVMEEEGT
jgi:pyruvate ferredoxin oxidoreductase delta subunit